MPRSLTSWEWYSDANTTRLFLHLLLTANYEAKQWQGIIVDRGQRIASYGKLAEETGLSVQSIRTAMGRLKATGEVTHEQHSKYGLYTLKNYESYAGANSQDNTQVTAGQHTSNSICKKARNKNGVFTPPTLEEVEAYCKETGSTIDPIYFFDKQTMVGWKTKNGQSIKDWKAAVRTWTKMQGTFQQQSFEERGNNKL